VSSCRERSVTNPDAAVRIATSAAAPTPCRAVTVARPKTSRSCCPDLGGTQDVRALIDLI
jgi:hypothetical protein